MKDKLQFFKPLGTSNLIKFIPMPKLGTVHYPPAYITWHLKGTDEDPWVCHPRDLGCPFCDAFTEATRVVEFTEAQLDWVW